MFRSFRKNDYPELEDELLVLCREWFDGQIGELPDDELRPQSEIEHDIIQMRDATLDRINKLLSNSDATRNRAPDDIANLNALTELLKKYAGHEATTPIFTKLALSKRGVDRYQNGWPLCTVRLIAESF